MVDNSQKTPVVQSLNAFAERKIAAALELMGKSLPCSVVSVSGSIVTVKFLVSSSFTLPNVTVPIATSIYARAPTQAGDNGVVRSVDTFIGAVSGLGTGTASLAPVANLSSLVFEPVASKSWAALDDPNAYQILGPNGAIVRTVVGSSSVTVNANGTSIKLPIGKSIQITTLPVSSAGLPPGSLWNNAGQVMVA
jgi:hypothetical protein